MAPKKMRNNNPLDLPPQRFSGRKRGIGKKTELAQVLATATELKQSECYNVGDHRSIHQDVPRASPALWRVGRFGVYADLSLAHASDLMHGERQASIYTKAAYTPECRQGPRDNLVYRTAVLYKVLTSLIEVVAKEVKKTGKVTIPGLVRFKTRVKPETKAGKRNMFGKVVMVAAKPAKTVVKAYPVAAIKKAIICDDDEPGKDCDLDSEEDLSSAPDDGTSSDDSEIAALASCLLEHVP